jgi:hypothetical protein
VPLGIAEPTCYNQTVVKLATGDVVVLYTDSLIEARGSDGRALGEQGLLALVRGLDPRDPGEFLRALLAGVARGGESGGGDGSGGPVSGDDVTVLILRTNGLKPRMSAGVMVKSMGRLAGAAVESLVPGGPPFPWPETGPLAKLGAFLNRVNRRWGVPQAASAPRR